MQFFQDFCQIALKNTKKSTLSIENPCIFCFKKIFFLFKKKTKIHHKPFRAFRNIRMCSVSNLLFFPNIEGRITNPLTFPERMGRHSFHGNGA